MQRDLRSRSSRLCAMVCVAMAAFCGGCRGKTPSSGLMPVVLQTDWYPQPEMGGFYQASLQGLYKAQGLDVTIVPGGPFVVAEQQVATGAAQFAMGSSDKVLVDVSQGVPLVAVAATMQQDPQAFMVHAESGVHGFSDLNGQTVAVRAGSIFYQFIVKKFNLNNVREIPATYSVANFLADKDYIQQCFVTSEPFFAEKAGAHVRTLLVSDTGYQPYRVIYASRQYLAEHPDVAAKFVTASMEGWKNYLADPEMVDEQLARLNPAMSREQMQFSIETLKRDRFIEGEGNADSHLGHFMAGRWNTTYDQLAALKVIAQPIDPSSAYTLKFAP
jgi:NitT/TauT family transport system substrate-binding protein